MGCSSSSKFFDPHIIAKVNYIIAVSSNKWIFFFHQFKNVAEIIRKEINPIVICVAESHSFNNWKRKEVDESDVVGDHLDLLEKEENKKAFLMNKIFLELYTD